MLPNTHVLIIEPNEQLTEPYSFFEHSFTCDRYSSVQAGLSALAQSRTDLLCISASFAIPKMLEVLDALKHKSVHELIPVLCVVDLSYHISHIPGTTWGNKLGVLTSLSSQDEYNSTLRRILNDQ